jgi:CRP/FNR family transcriptional regulator, cyclic AMP receptor protein
LKTRAKSPQKLHRSETFDLRILLSRLGAAKKAAEFGRKEVIYGQGDAADSVMYIERGGVRLSVLNAAGREAVVAMFGPGDFFGEGCMSGQTVRMGTATAIAPTTVIVVGKETMLKALHAEREFSDHFIKYLLTHNIRVEEDLIDQLFSSSEKRLARTLLLLARYGEQDQTDGVLPNVSQETLAEMVGTTRSRVNFFMNKFRKLGFVEYDGKIKVKKSLLTVVLHD